MRAATLSLVLAGLPPERWRDLAGPDTRAAYLGLDEVRREAAAAALGEAAFLPDFGERLNAIAGEIRTELINLDRTVADPGDALWQASDLAERNPYASRLQHSCCALLAGLELLESARAPGGLLFIVEDLAVCLALARAARPLGWRVRLRLGRPILDRWPGLALLARRARLLLQGIVARRDLLREHARRRRLLKTLAPPVPSGDFDLLLVTWADAARFAAGPPRGTDRFWGALPDFLRRRGLRVAHLANPLEWMEPYDAIAAALAGSAEPACLAEQAQSLAAAARDAWRTLLWRPRRAERFRLAGRDLEPLFRDALAQERAGARQCFALKFRSVGAWLKRMGARPAAMLCLFENQPWEKLLRLGLAEAFPGIATQGYLHAPFSRQYLSAIPSARDIAAGRLPSRLLVPGAAWRQIFRDAGLPEERLGLAPALRFAHLFDRAADHAEPAEADARTEPRFAVLVIGPLDRFELHDMLSLLHQAAEGLPGLEVWVKLHPNMHPDAVRAVLDEFPPGDRLKVTRTPVPQLLARVDAMTYTSSAACYEALAAGLTPIYIGSGIRLDMDKLDWFPELRLRAGSAAELLDRLRSLADAPAGDQAERRRKSHAAARELFLPPDEPGLAAFLPTHPHPTSNPSEQQ
jgi:surface carbohydrate biosynthesis protein (TIGR04326 family)